MGQAVFISVVIPTVDEVTAIGRALSCTREPQVEQLVADGGSADGTPQRAGELGARVIPTRRGRAHQMEAGFQAAKGDVILFLHADTWLEPGWSNAVRDVLRDPAVSGGAFRFRLDRRGAGPRFIEFGARLRVRLSGLPYGDQALFMRRAVLEGIGGVPDVPIFEDLDLVRAIRAHGELALLPRPATTSARRYLRNGVIRTWLRNTLALAAWWAGMDRERVARWYRRRPSR